MQGMVRFMFFTALAIKLKGHKRRLTLQYMCKGLVGLERAHSDASFASPEKLALARPLVRPPTNPPWNCPPAPASARLATHRPALRNQIVARIRPDANPSAHMPARLLVLTPALRNQIQLLIRPPANLPNRPPAQSRRRALGWQRIQQSGYAKLESAQTGGLADGRAGGRAALQTDASMGGRTGQLSDFATLES